MDKRNDAGITYEACVAYYRDALSPSRTARVQTYLEAHPDVARRARVDAANERAILQSSAGVLEETLPERLQIGARPAVSPWPHRIALAAAIVLSAAGGWWLGGLSVTGDPTADFATRVASAANRTPESVSVHKASTHPGIEIQPPDLSRRGYRLVKQNLLGSGADALVEFVYQGRSGKSLRIFAESDVIQQVAPTVKNLDGMSLALWRANGTRYALVGDLSAMTLKTLAQAATTQRPGDGTQLAGAGRLQNAGTGEVSEVTDTKPMLPVDDAVVPATISENQGIKPGRM